MNRGSRARRAGRLGRVVRFNEAPIHESGKSRRSGPSSRRGDCFNEAPIHESGKLDATRGSKRGCYASMRPRFMNRGSWRVVAECPGERMRFNEAPIHESGKCVSIRLCA